PAAELGRDAGQPLGTQDQERYHEDQQQLGEAGVEHRYVPSGRRFAPRAQACDALSFCSPNSASGACFDASASRRFASSTRSLSSSCSIALRKLLSAPPRSPPRVFRRFVPKISTTISRTIRSCQMLTPPSPISIPPKGK